MYAEAESLYDSENDSLCIIKLDELIQQYPSHTDAIYLRAFAKHRSGKLAEAIEDYNLYIQLNSKDEEAYYFRAVAKYHVMDSSALEDYNKVISLNPQYGEAYNNRAMIYLERNENEKACLDLKTALELGIKVADSAYEKYCQLESIQ